MGLEDTKIKRGGKTQEKTMQHLKQLLYKLTTTSFKNVHDLASSNKVQSCPKLFLKDLLATPKDSENLKKKDTKIHLYLFSMKLLMVNNQ